MALVFNNVTVPQSGNVIYNGTSLSVVKHGNTQVWKLAPEYLYNNGDQCSGFTGGWDARAAYFLNTDTYYRNQTGTKPVFNTGNISVTCTGSYLGGGSVITNWPVDLSAVSSLTASINKFDPTETYSAFNIYLLSAWPTINADNSYVAAVRVLGNQQATSVTLNTSGYNGSYYVLMGFSNNNSRWKTKIQGLEDSYNKLLASVKSNSQTNVPSGANNTRSGNDSTANHYAALLAQVQAQQDAAARRAEELARQKQEAAQAAYDKNMGYLNEAYANRSNLLQQNYNDALAQLQASYDSGARGVNQNADSAQQQAYINYMMSKRDLPQALAAQGLTGGMSESALAGMYNSYGNNRNTIDRGRNESLAALLDTLNSNRSSALQSYNSQLSAAEQQKMAYQMQLEQALANGSAEILQNKYDTLQNLDNAYAQQILALQQAAAQAAQKRW